MKGAGLGDRFLGHAERCGAILHLIDGTESGVVKAYKNIRGELEAYGHGLSEKPEILVLNKIDAIPKAALVKRKPRWKKPAAEGRVAFRCIGRRRARNPAHVVKLIAKRRAKEKGTPARAKSWAP